MNITRLHAGTFSVLLLLVVGQACFAAGSRNLIPRMPEIVIERGYSDAFQVVDCVASSMIKEETAESSLQVVLKNITDKPIESSVKVRILYLASDHGAQILVNGKAQVFNRKNPRIPFSLTPGQSIDLQVKARHNIQYSLEALKKEQAETGGLSNGISDTKKNFSFNELMKLFEKENFGKRFLIGPVVSKWGIFPVDFKHIRLDVTVPKDFVGVFPKEGIWQKADRHNATQYTFEGTEGYNGAMFVPKTDARDIPANPAPQGMSASSEATTLR